MTDAAVEVWGEGTRAVLVHGSLATGPLEWAGQRPLAAEGYELVVPTRRAYVTVGHGEDFVTDGEDVAGLLADGAHLVGHSYGALVAIVAARLRPTSVRSLVLAEPPLFGVAADHPDVARLQAAIEEVLAGRGGDRDFVEAFLRAVGTPVEELDGGELDELAALAPALRGARQPWQTALPVDHLASASYPVVVVSGGHHPAFTAVCEALAQDTGARLTTVPGAGHEVQAVEGFTALLREVWREA